jgi:hypothetical protein
MTPKVWGPPIWIFLHSFSVNISEEGYARVGGQFFSFLTRICRMLPCPDCADHATKFISLVKLQTLKTKYDMANMLCNFHNSVNKRKRLPFFHNLRLSSYEKVNILSAFNNFVIAFTLPSQRLMNESLHRKMLAGQLTKFMSTSLVYFIKPIQISASPPPPLPLPIVPPIAPSPATEPAPPAAAVTELDLEYEGAIKEESDEEEQEDFSSPNIRIEIVVEDFTEEENDLPKNDARFLMSI